MNELELITAELAVYKSAFTKFYNKTETELDAIVKGDEGVKDDAFDALSTIDASRAKKLKGDGQQMFDKGAQKREAELKTKLENSFKEVTGYSGNAETIEEMFAEYHAEQATKTKKSTLTDDDVKKHPVYLALEKERVPKADFEKVKTEFETYKTDVQRNEKISNIKSKVLKKFNEFQIEQIDNPAVKSKRTELFLKEFDAYDYELDGDNIIIVKDGKRLEDAHGNLIQFDKFVESTAQEHFVFLKQSPKENANNKNKDDNQQQNKVTVKDEDDYKAKMAEIDLRESKEKDPAKILLIRKERAEVGKAFMGLQK